MSSRDEYSFFLNGWNSKTDQLVNMAMQDIRDSGLSPETLTCAGIRIFNNTSDVLKQRLGFSRIDNQPIVNVCRLIEFSYFDDKGEVTRYEYKPFPAIYFKGDEKPRKYLQAKGQPPTPYILPDVWKIKEKTNQILWITEGVKKVLSLVQYARHAIGLSGVWNFKSVSGKEKFLWKQLESFNWKGRTVFIGFDSDLWVNPGVRFALYELAFKLYSRGAIIRFPLWTGAKGIDDYLASNSNPLETLSNVENNAKSLDAFLTYEHQQEILRAAMIDMDAVLKGNLISMIASAFKRKPKEIEAILKQRRERQLMDSVEPIVNPYFMDAEGYLSRWREKRDGINTSMRIANFSVRITEEITEDNGQETTKKFTIGGGTKDKIFPQTEVNTSQFATLNWVMNQWGNDAIIEPGPNIKDYLRHFIQVYSNGMGIKHKTVYTHTGWRNMKGNWIYLMANGSIGGNGVSVNLPGEFLDLGRYCLPSVPENEAEAIRMSLSFLFLAKEEITYPAYAYLFLSPLTSLLDPIPNFSAYFIGETGTFKSTVATLLLSHYGNFSIRALSNFDSTANQIEKRAFVLKDTLMVLDDYYPSARQKEAQQKETIAQRMIRSYSNRTGRERLNPDATEKRKYAPRGMLLITGEEMVQLQSTLARIMVVEFNHGDVDMKKLTDLQGNAHFLPHAMTSYILWVRNNLDTIKESFKKSFPELREKVLIEKIHKKIPEQAAYLQFSFDTVLRWAHENKVIDDTERKVFSNLGWNVFCNIGRKHGERISEDDPVTLFLEIIKSLMIQGRIRLDHKKHGFDQCRGGIAGELIGYYDEDFCYLLPVPTWHTLTSYVRLEGSYFPFSKNTLYDVLAKRGYLCCKDGRHTVSERINGKVMKVLRIVKSDSTFGNWEVKDEDDD